MRLSKLLAGPLLAFEFILVVDVNKHENGGSLAAVNDLQWTC